MCACGRCSSPGIGSPGSGPAGRVASVGRLSEFAVRRMRSPVVVAACWPARTIPAIDAPVSRRIAASIRNTKRMCEPAFEKRVLDTQSSDSPTSPPWLRR